MFRSRGEDEDRKGARAGPPGAGASRSVDLLQMAFSAKIRAFFQSRRRENL